MFILIFNDYSFPYNFTGDEFVAIINSLNSNGYHNIAENLTKAYLEWRFSKERGEDNGR